MMRGVLPKSTIGVCIALLCGAAALPAWAQEGDAPAAAAPIIVEVPAAAPAEVIVPGYPAPGTNLDAHLPSSSQSLSDTSSSRDGYDLAPDGASGGTMQNANGSYVVEGSVLPEGHTVRRGDTLWEISDLYTKNAYNWPRVWALNPQILNPHWIYPGDRVRLKNESDRGGTVGLGRGRSVPRETVFLRDVGWVDDRKEDTWGEVVGSPDDQMLLSDGDPVYLQIDEGHEVNVGDELTIFRPLQKLEGGQLVSIRGTAKVDRWNPKTRMVRARINESLDVIERGAKVGPVERRFDVVPPVTNAKDVEARIVASIYPHQLFGGQQVVFLDKGEKDGLQPGNRLFAVRRGDRWRESLRGSGSLSTARARVEDDAPAEIDYPELDADEDLFPDETYGELRILKVREHSASAIVTASTGEIEREAVLVARQGY